MFREFITACKAYKYNGTGLYITVQAFSEGSDTAVSSDRCDSWDSR